MRLNDPIRYAAPERQLILGCLKGQKSFKAEESGPPGNKGLEVQSSQLSTSSSVQALSTDRWFGGESVAPEH